MRAVLLTFCLVAAAVPLAAATAASWTTLAGTVTEHDTFRARPAQSCSSVAGAALVLARSDGGVLFEPATSCDAQECATGPDCTTRAWTFAASGCARDASSFECVDPRTDPPTSLYGFVQRTTLVAQAWRVSFATTDATNPSDPGDVVVSGTLATAQG